MNKRISCQKVPLLSKKFIQKTLNITPSLKGDAKL